jgi:class 3 adenylate cyclase
MAHLLLDCASPDQAAGPRHHTARLGARRAIGPWENGPTVEGVGPTDTAEQSIGDRARDALGRHAWSEAHELLSDADAAGSLEPDELELLADASWWVGKLPAAIEARERAYAGYVKDGNPVMAAAAAAALGHENLLRGTYPVAAAWLNRADRHLAGIDDTIVHGWLAVVRAFQLSLEGRYEEVLAQSERAGELAATFGDRNLGTLALSCEGLARIHHGEVEKGLAQVDEATIAAVGGEIEPATAGGVCCSTIEACAALGDWKRAAQWTEAQDRWCRREHINGFPGMCRVFRAGIKRLRGDWLEAESEARRATDELAGFLPAAVGMAQYEIGLIRLRRGDLTSAEESLTRAHALGRHPEPALSLVRLAQGRVDVALASIRRALDEPDTSPSWASPQSSELGRLALLPAQAEIALAAGDVALARAAADELTGLAQRFPSVASAAAAAQTAGEVLAAEGDPGGAARLLRKAVEHWTDFDAPYDAARARMSLGTVYHLTGDDGAARLELQAARTELERLGAVGDLRRAEQALDALGGDEARSSGARQRVARTFVFTDIVDSTRLNELLGDDAWGSLIRWHDQTIRSIAAEHAGEEVKGTGDGFFLAFADTDDAIEAAIAIQRRFDAQRTSQGFAPALRIGIHRAEANRAGLDYTGTGVNLAARVEAAAAGGEVLVSGETLGVARRQFRESDRRSVEMKGFAESVDVVAIDWR